MGKVTDKGISGAVGNVIYYSYRGINCIRAKPGRRKKKRGHKKDPVNETFGNISTYGSKMLLNIKNKFLFHFGPEPYNRLRGWMSLAFAAKGADRNWHVSTDSGMCQISNDTDLRDYLKTTVTVSVKGGSAMAVHFPEIIPAAHIKAPPRTAKVKIKVIAISSAFRVTGIANGFDIKEFSMDYSKKAVPANDIILKLQAQPGDIAMVAVALEYEVAGESLSLTDPRWLPAALIALGRLK